MRDSVGALERPAARTHLSSSVQAAVSRVGYSQVLAKGCLEEVQALAFDETETDEVRLMVLRDIDRRLAGATEALVDSMPFFLKLAAETDSDNIARHAMARVLGRIKMRDGSLTQAREFIADQCHLYAGEGLAQLAEEQLEEWHSALEAVTAALSKRLPASGVDLPSAIDIRAPTWERRVAVLNALGRR